MSKHIFWIPSYPKSGNTLVRSILVSLFFTTDGIFDFKLLQRIKQFDTMTHINQNKGLFGNDIKKIDDLKILSKYWLKLQEKKALNFSEDFIFLKTHSSNTLIDKKPFTVEENCKGIIYIVRDPRDVCISFSRHFNKSYEESINCLMDKYLSIYWKQKKINSNLVHKKPSLFLSDWKTHVISWTKHNWKTPLLILKYEDLIYDKKKQINKIIIFFEEIYKFRFNNREKKIENIILSTNFEKLKKEEELNGFIEAGQYSNFYAVGQKDQWKEFLNKKQILSLKNEFGNIMEEYGYV